MIIIMVIVCNVIMYNSSLCACMIHSFGILYICTAVRVLILQHNNDDDDYYQKNDDVVIINNNERGGGGS